MSIKKGSRPLLVMPPNMANKSLQHQGDQAAAREQVHVVNTVAMFGGMLRME